MTERSIKMMIDVTSQINSIILIAVLIVVMFFLFYIFGGDKDD